MSIHYKSVSSKTPNPSSIFMTSENEISTRIKKVKEVATATYSFLLICLSHNLVAVTILWSQGMIETHILYLAIAYLLLGVPAAYFSWYRELNLGLSGENGFVFSRFFAVYMFHIVFCLFAWFDPFMEKSLTGITSGMLIYFEDGLSMAGIYYFTGAVFFFAEYVMSVWVLSNVHKLYIQGVFSYGDYGDNNGDLESINGSNYV
ncbi:hypothetical protein M5689_008745 [Euphorbia peplus]|nr:hypothetical protein M5689_008745 [Euphorbia peplus]